MSDEGPAYEIAPLENRVWGWKCRRCYTQGRSPFLTEAASDADEHVVAAHPTPPPIPTDEGTVIRGKANGRLLRRSFGEWVLANVGTSWTGPVPARRDYDVAEWS